jgi:prevent-host-death family protein
VDTVKATEARANLYGLIDRVEENHEPVLITGKRSNAVLIAEDDWRSVQETLYLLSVPGMRESLLQGMSTPTSKLKKSLTW